MKKFAVRIFQITLIIFMVSLLLNQVIYPALNIAPWSWGSDLLESKRKALRQPEQKFNSVIIGSSRVYRQVNPQLLDSLLVAHQLKTYNLGVNWLFAPESFYVLDQLTGSDKLQFKCVIIELSKIRSVDYANMHTARIKYWYTFPDFVFTVKAIAGSNFSIVEKGATILAHTISYIDKLINLGYLTETFNFNAVTNAAEGNIETKEINGYLPLGSFENETTEENTRERRHKFLNDTTVVTRRLETSIKQFKKFDENPELLKKYNRFYANELDEMIAAARNNGTHLVFLLSPRIDHNQYNELIPLFNRIHPHHRIEISDGRKYPELYRTANSFDETHLNTAGANYYTTILAKKLDELLSKSQSTGNR